MLIAMTFEALRIVGLEGLGLGNGSFRRGRADVVPGCPQTAQRVDKLSKSGEPRRTRTCNPLIKSQLLYQLS